MSSRKCSEIFTGGEGQKQTSAAAKTKQKKASNASDSPPGQINLSKKSIKKNNLSQKALKLEPKNVKTSKVIKKNEKESEDSDEKKDFVKKSTKPKLKEKLTTKTVKKLVKEVKKGKNSNSGNCEKVEKCPKPKKPVKKLEEKEEKKLKEKVQKEKKVKEVKKKPIPKPVKKSIEEIEPIKSRVDTKSEKKDKPKKARVIAKNKSKLNSTKKIDDNPPIECMDVVKDEKPDDVALLQVFQLKNGPVCDFDGSVCNTITIRQDNTCIKIKEISVSQLPYSVKTEENEKMDVTSTPVKKESKQNIENQKTEKLSADKQKLEKQKTEKLKKEKPKPQKLKTEKNKIQKQKSQKPEKQKPEKQKPEKPVTKPATKPIKVEKNKKTRVDKIKPKGKTKVIPKIKAKGRPVSKRPRVASLNAIAKVHCLYENESKGALIDAMTASATNTMMAPPSKKKNDSDVDPPARKGKRTSKRTTPGLKSVGRHWDMHDTSSTNSSSSGIIFILIKFWYFYKDTKLECFLIKDILHILRYILFKTFYSVDFYNNFPGCLVEDR